MLPLKTSLTLTDELVVDMNPLKRALADLTGRDLLKTLGEIPSRTHHHRAQAPRWAPTVVELTRQMSLV